MFSLAASGGRQNEGIRMGLFGAAQGVAFGIGGIGGSSLSDLMRYLLGTPDQAYALVFATEAVLFLVSAWLAGAIGREVIVATTGQQASAFSLHREASVHGG